MIGFGFDVHKLAEGESLVLGGVELESKLGTVAHSDGDVLLHAIMDAMLGAAALGDIGLLFPDTDAQWKGANSVEMLSHVRNRLYEQGLELVNIDSTVVLEAPKLRPHVDSMREKIAGAAGLELKRVSVKATTNEKLGFIGREEGVAAYAVCEVRERSARA